MYQNIFLLNSIFRHIYLDELSIIAHGQMRNDKTLFQSHCWSESVDKDGTQFTGTLVLSKEIGNYSILLFQNLKDIIKNLFFEFL